MKKLIAFALALWMLAAPCLAEGIGAAQLCGKWQDPYYGRAVLEIEPAEDGNYDIRLRWGSSASSEGVWHMSARLEGDSLVYEGGTMSVVNYAESGECVEEDVQWDDAEGAFTLTAGGSLLWWDSREERAPEFRLDRIAGALEALTGLDMMRYALEDGAQITSACYTDGYGFADNGFTTVDPDEIAALWAALNRIEVVGRTDEDITDWYPQIAFTLSTGETYGARFDAQWLEVGGMNHYLLAEDGDFWALTGELMQKYDGE